MPVSAELTIDRKATVGAWWSDAHVAVERGVGQSARDEQPARETLRAQIARLEHELSGIVTASFPHISPSDVHATDAAGVCVEPSRGPRLLDLGELERLRDCLAAQVSETRAMADRRAEFEQASRELLRRIKLEPGSYKFARLPVADLGEGGCGVWEVRPRLGLIGMLAGWWHVKLSSGCPLARGSRPVRDPAPLTGR